MFLISDCPRQGVTHKSLGLVNDYSNRGGGSVPWIYVALCRPSADIYPGSSVEKSGSHIEYELKSSPLPTYISQVVFDIELWMESKTEALTVRSIQMLRCRYSGSQLRSLRSC
jgi:hypothetical protein